MFSFNIQRLVHWLDIGEGKKVLAVLALVAFVLLFSAYHSYKRFAGPQTEYVIQQNLIGKHLAKGDGFATSVVFPQTVAVLEKLHNLSFDRDQALPDFYHAPLYPAVIAGGLLLIPESLESLLWEDPYFVGDVIPTGFNADYYVLVINLIFFWISCLLVYFLGRRLYSPRAGLISLFGVLFSVGLWDQVMAVTGISILVCLDTVDLLSMELSGECET